MKRVLPLLALAATLVAPAPAQLVASASDVGGIALGATTRCIAPTAARATLRARSLVTTRYTAAVDGRVVKAGTLRPDATRTVAVVVAVPADRASRVVLRLAGRAVVNSPVPAACPAVPVAPAAPVVAPVVTPVVAPVVGAFALNTAKNGSTVRWNPCDGAITVKVNAPAEALADVQSAIAQVRAATGLDVVYDGTTTFVPSSTNTASQPADLVLSWATRTQSDHWSGSAVGVGGWYSRGSSTDGGATWNWKITQGFVVIDPAAQVTPGFGKGQTRGALLLHELAHAFGLDHVTDTAQVMYPTLLNSATGAYGSGDRAGLAAVGAGQGCTTAA